MSCRDLDVARPPRRARLAVLAFLCIAPILPGSGCAHSGAGHSGSVRRIDMEPMKLTVVRGPGAGARVEALDAGGLFEQGGADLKAGRYGEAAAAYDRLEAEFPDSRYRESALYNAGLSYEGLKRYGDAAARYRKLLSVAPAGKDAVDAQFRLGACLAESQQWAESEAIFTAVLSHQELGASDRIEAMSRRGLAQLELGSLEAAERSFQETVAYFQKNEAAERLETDFFLAMAHFYLANIQHRHFQALPVRLPQRQLEQDIEAKAKVFLVAQGRYIETIRLKNPAWATASGFQIGALYKEMYELLLGAPMPPELDTEEKQRIYAEMLREKLRGLLMRARRIHEKNVEMAERVGVDNDWVKRSGEQLAELERMLEEARPGDKAQAVEAQKGGARSEPPPPPPLRPLRPGKGRGDSRPQTIL